MPGHDWSISDEPICYDRIDRSDMTPWVCVRSPRLGSPIWYDLIRSGASLHVHYDPVRSVVIGYEFALNYCPDYDMGDHDLATIGPNRHINSQADSIHILPELLQGENYNPRPSIMAGFEVGGWLDWLRPKG